MQRSLQEQMDEILNSYPDKLNEALEEESRRAALTSQQMLKTTSPRKKGRGGGKYARGWQIKPETGVLRGYIVYNPKHPQLTHLLENGHRISNQYGSYDGRVPGKKHIKPVEEAMSMKFELALKARINRGLY